MTQAAQSSPATGTTARPMRLAYLTTEYPKASHTFIRREILELERRGHEIVRLAIRDSAGAIADPVDRSEEERTFHCLRCSPLRLIWDALVVKLSHPVRWTRAALMMWRMSRRSDRGLLRHIAYLIEAACLLREARRRGVKHVHVHFGTNAAAVARAMHALGGPTYSMTIHGPGEFDAPIGFSLGGKVADAAFVAAITDYCSAQLRRWAAPEHWDKINVVHCTVDDTFFEAAAPISDDSRTLVCVGRLSAQKGHLVLLEAAAKLREEGVEFRITLAGDGELRGLLEKKIAEQGLEEHVAITGWIGEEDVRRHLLASRGLVLPSFAEGLPVVIMEAMALGRPVVTTRITGIPELVRDGENGWLVTAANVDELTDAMRSILAAPVARLDEMGHAGCRRVRQGHRLADEIVKLEALFARVVQGDDQGS
jgi:glycosyltransferase involved in cell wall biosynthesis